jgi:hypothetical protein
MNCNRSQPTRGFRSRVRSKSIAQRRSSPQPIEEPSPPARQHRTSTFTWPRARTSGLGQDLRLPHGPVSYRSLAGALARPRRSEPASSCSSQVGSPARPSLRLDRSRAAQCHRGHRPALAYRREPLPALDRTYRRQRDSGRASKSFPRMSLALPAVQGSSSIASA